MRRVQDPVVFLGGEGEDKITIDTLNGVVTARFNRSVDPILGSDMAYMALSDGTWSSTTWYAVEKLSLSLMSCQYTYVYIDATLSDMELLQVTGGWSRNWFTAGGEAGRPLTDIHGTTGTDTCLLTLMDLAPAVGAGADVTVPSGIPVSLAGSFTDPGQSEGESYISAWTVRNSAGLAVAGQQGSALTFTTHMTGVYTATLTVTVSDDPASGPHVLSVSYPIRNPGM